MTLTQITLLAMIGGIILLAVALNTVKKICAYEDKKHHGWAHISHLIFLFIYGYTLFSYYILTNKTTYIELVIAMILLGAGWLVLIVSRLSMNSIRRVDERVKVERYRALHDPLTALPNRTLFHERINHALALAKREKNEIALMIIDLNEFKEVNDTLGHQTGDTLLKQASQRLKDILRESDTLARYGGDEFAVILPQTSRTQANLLAERLMNTILQPFLIGNTSLSIGMSVGISMYPYHGTDSNTLIKHADIAMYRAKRHQKGVLLFEDEMRDPFDSEVNVNFISSSVLQEHQAIGNDNRLLN